MVLLLLGIAAWTVTPSGPGARAAEKRLAIGWTAWSDAEVVTKLARRLLEERMGYEVTLTLVDIAIQYQGVARGDIDAMLMGWLPDTHRDYHERYGTELVDLGPIYTGARLGWVVPDYVPLDELASIVDLARPEVRRRLRDTIQGIDPGAGLMRLSEHAIEAYGLERYNLVSASGAAMTVMLERAMRRDKWIVVTAWRPHWMFSKWSLRFLADPKGALGGLERVHALVRRGLYAEYRDAVEFLARMFVPLDELEATMSQAENTSYDAAVEHYIQTHPRRVTYWVTGKIE